MGPFRFMNKKVKEEIEEIIKEGKLSYSIEKFQEKHNWQYIEQYKTVSLDFIKEFKDKVEWYWVLWLRKLPEDFIYEMKDYIKFDYVVKNFEDLVKKDEIKPLFVNQVHWDNILKYKKVLIQKSIGSKKEEEYNRFEILDL